MKLQHATRYAIWSILELASRQGEQVSANEIAATYGVSQHHLAKVLRTLARARIMSSVRCPGGGFMFMRWHSNPKPSSNNVHHQKRLHKLVRLWQGFGGA